MPDHVFEVLIRPKEPGAQEVLVGELQVKVEATDPAGTAHVHMDAAMVADGLRHLAQGLDA